MKQAETPQETTAVEKEQEALKESTRHGSLVYGGGFAGSSGEDGTNNRNPYMPAFLQQKMERAFGHDFSNVNIYSNSDQANNEGVEAFTYGNDIHFSTGAYNPYSEDGQSLLVHELTHVIQQRQGRVADNDKLLEEEADHFHRNRNRIKVSAGVDIRYKTKHYKIYRISAEDITKIRDLLSAGKELDAYNELTRKIKSDFALTNFFADYPDIGKQLFEKLNPEKLNPEKLEHLIAYQAAYTRVKKTFTPRVQAIDDEGRKALTGFKEKRDLFQLTSLATKYKLNLEEVLAKASISSEEAMYNPDDLLLKLEAGLKKSSINDERYVGFISDLSLYNLIYKIERQAGLQDDIPIAKDGEYWSKIKYIGTAYGYKGARFAAARAKRKAIAEVKGRSAKKEVKEKYEEQYKLPDKLPLGLNFLGKRKPLVIKGLKFSEMEKMVHWKGGFYGISFDPNAIIDELIIDKKNFKTTIIAKNLTVDKFDMTDTKGGFIADQLALSDVRIELDYQDEKGDELSVVGKKETSHARVKFKSDIDLHGLRMVSENATTGIGRLRFSNLNLVFEQDISARENIFAFAQIIKSPVNFQLGTLIALLYKGPMLLNPIINGIVNVFTSDPANNETTVELLTAHANDYKDAFKDMLAEDLSLSINYDKIQLDHLLMTDTSYTDKKELPYIEKLVIGGSDSKSEIELNTHKISQRDIDEALNSERLNDLTDEVASIVKATTTIEAYTQLKIKSQEAKASTSKENQLIVEASHYFELFRQTDFKVFSPIGSISGATILTQLTNFSLPGILKEVGMELTGIEGVGDFSYSNFRIVTSQNGTGLVNDTQTANEISLNLEVPNLKADSMKYDRDGILFTSIAPQLKMLTVGINLQVNPVGSEIPYSYSIGKVEIKQAELEKTTLVSGENMLNFSSEHAVADNVWFEMGSTSNQEKMGFGFERFKLNNALVTIGNRTIKSETDKPITLEGLDFNSDKTGLVFNLQNLSVFGEYVDENGSKVPFEKNKNLPDEQDRKMIHYRKSVSGHEYFSLFFNTPIVIPSLLLVDENKNKLKLSRVLINGVFIDVEKYNDVLLINTIHFEELSASDYEVDYGNNHLKSKQIYTNGITDLFENNFGRSDQQSHQLWPAQLPLTYADTNHDLDQVEDTTPFVKDQTVNLNEKPLVLKNVGLGNLIMDAENFGPKSSWDFGWKSDQIPPTISSNDLSYPNLGEELIQTTDNTPFVKDLLLPEIKTTVFRRKSTEDNAYIGWEDLFIGESAFNAKGDNFKELIINVLSAKQFLAESVNGKSFMVSDIMQLFAKREIGEFTNRGTITGKNKKFIGSWETESLNNKKIGSYYDLETNYTTFENLPVLNLKLEKINMSFGDFRIKSKTLKDSPAEVSKIALKGVRINHTTGELEIDRISIDAVTANGLTVDAFSPGWHFDLKVDQRASVNNIVLEGWKTKLTDPSIYGPQGKKASIEITSILIPKLISNLSDSEKETSHAETSASIGRISYLYKSSGAQLLTIRDLLFTDSTFEFIKGDEFVMQFLKSVSAREIVLEQDAQGRKLIRLTDPTIKGYTFITSNGISVTADLKCTGEMEFYDGNYDDFVADMPRTLKLPLEERKTDRSTKGNINAWIFDASRCKIEMTNVSYEKEALVETRTTDQLLLDELLYLRSDDKSKPFSKNTSLSERGINEQNAPELLTELKERLRGSAKDKISSQEKQIKENQRMINMLRALDDVDGEIYLTVNKIITEFKVQDGKIDLDQLKDALCKLSTELIDSVNPKDLIHNDRLKALATSIYRYIVVGSSADAIAIGFALGAIFGIVGGILGPAGASLGFITGCFLGIFLGGILSEVVKFLFRDVLGLVTNLCRAIMKGEDYREPLKKLVKWCIMHLGIIIENDKPYIGFTLDGYDEVNKDAYISKSMPLFQIGDKYDSHIDKKTNEIGIGGFLRYKMRHPGRADRTEFDLSEKIWLNEKEGKSAFEIFEELYFEKALPAEDFSMNGLGGFFNGQGFVNGSLSPELRDDLSVRIMNGISQLNITTTLNHVDLGTLEDVFNFDNKKQRLHFLNSEKKNLYTYSSLNADDILENGNAALRLTTTPISGFTLLESDKSMAIGLGDISVPEFKLQNVFNENDSKTQVTKIETKSPLILNGFQVAKVKEGTAQEKNNLPAQPKKEQPLIIQPLGVKNPQQYPSYELKGKGYEKALFEFSMLSGLELTHIAVVDGNFLNQGDPWYLDMLTKTGLKKSCRIGFIRECDTWDNKIENYIGTLEVDDYGSRNYKPFKGNKNDEFTPHHHLQSHQTSRGQHQQYR